MAAQESLILFVGLITQVGCLHFADKSAILTMFSALVAFSCYFAFNLDQEFREIPKPFPRYIVYELVAGFIVLRLWIYSIVPGSPQDLRHIWDATSDLMASFSTDLPRRMATIGILPLHMILTAVPFSRSPNVGAKSCPWAVWMSWSYGCHYLWLVNVQLGELMPDTAFHSTFRYLMAVGALADVYHQLALFSHGDFKWAALVSLVPVLSHIIGQVAEDLGQPYNAVYCLAGLISCVVCSWQLNLSEADS